MMGLRLNRGTKSRGSPMLTKSGASSFATRNSAREECRWGNLEGNAIWHRVGDVIQPLGLIAGSDYGT